MPRGLCKDQMHLEAWAMSMGILELELEVADPSRTVMDQRLNFGKKVP